MGTDLSQFTEIAREVASLIKEGRNDRSYVSVYRSGGLLWLSSWFVL